MIKCIIGDAALRAHAPEAAQNIARGRDLNVTLREADEGRWRGTAMVRYAKALFVAEFEVHPTGMVEMLNDEPLATWDDEKDATGFKNDGGIFCYD